LKKDGGIFALIFLVNHSIPTWFIFFVLRVCVSAKRWRIFASNFFKIEIFYGPFTFPLVISAIFFLFVQRGLRLGKMMKF
jgi:hypothetical protein